MSKSHDHVNTTEIVGRLGRDPELQKTGDGTPYVKLSIATSEQIGRGEQSREKVEWHRATAWGKAAEEIAGQFKKGDSIAVSGTLRINSYEKEGNKNRVTEVTIEQARKNLDNAPSKNETRLVGVVREDPKVHELRGGKSMTTISIATTTTANGKARDDWHSVTAWGNTGVAAREIKAGDTIEVNGAIRHRMVGEEGAKRKLSAIECQRFQVLERAQALEVPPVGPKVRRGRGKGIEQGM
jgi:single-strand DNA-binding protein